MFLAGVGQPRLPAFQYFTWNRVSASAKPCHGMQDSRHKTRSNVPGFLAAADFHPYNYDPFAW
eukprot:262990-Lingulodinium_polyedra.AAC.1